VGLPGRRHPTGNRTGSQVIDITPETRPMKAQLSIAECVAVEVMRARETEPPRSRENLDFEAVKHADWKKDGSLAFPAGPLSNRAFLVLQEDSGSDWRGWLEGLTCNPFRRTVHLGLLVAVLSGILSWTTWQTILKPSTSGRVSIEPFCMLLGLVAAWLLLPLVVRLFRVGRSFLSILRGDKSAVGQPNPVSDAEPGNLVWWKPARWAFRKGFLQAVTCKLGGREAADPRKFLDVAVSVLRVLDRPVAAMWSCFKHCGCFAAHLVILVTLLVDMTLREEYDFEWRSTVLSRADKQWVLRHMPTAGDAEALSYYLSPWTDRQSVDGTPARVVSRFVTTGEKDLLRRVRNLPDVGSQSWGTISGPDPPGLASDLEASTLALAAIQDFLATERWSHATRDSAVQLGNRLREITAVVTECPGSAAAPSIGAGLARLQEQRARLRERVRTETTDRGRQRLAEQCRRDIGWLIISLLLLVGVLPQVVCGVLALIEFSAALRSLRPNLNHPDVQQMIRSLETSQRSGRHAAETTPSIAVPGPPVVPKPAVGAPGRSQEPDPARAGTCLFVAGYELTPLEAGWRAGLELGGAPIHDLGNIHDSKARASALATLRAAADRVAGVLLVVDYSVAPGRVLCRFLDEFFSCVPDDGHDRRCVLVQTNIERARRKYTHRSSSELAASWNDLLAELDLDTDHVVTADLDRLTSDSRARLRDRWSRIWPAIFESASPGVEPAVRFPEAFNIIVKSSISAEQHGDRRRIGRLLDDTLRRIDGLYARESALWRRRLEHTVDSWSDNAKRKLVNPGQLVGAIDSSRSRASALLECGPPRWAASVLLRFGRLPAWQKAAVLGSGVLALAVPAAGPLVVAGPMASSTLLGGICATVGITTVALAGLLGGKHSAGQNDIPHGDDSAPLCLDDLVRSGIVRTVILELQGRPPEQIADCLESILGGCRGRRVTSSDQARQLCDSAGRLLYTTGGELPLASGRSGPMTRPSPCRISPSCSGISRHV